MLQSSTSLWQSIHGNGNTSFWPKTNETFNPREMSIKVNEMVHMGNVMSFKDSVH